LHVASGIASFGAAISGVGVVLSMIYFSMEQSSSSFPAQVRGRLSLPILDRVAPYVTAAPHVSSGSLATGSNQQQAANVCYASDRYRNGEPLKPTRRANSGLMHRRRQPLYSIT
jgi:hypothetical protein